MTVTMDHRATPARPHTVWAVLLLVPLVLASCVAPAASRPTNCPREGAGQEAEEPTKPSKSSGEKAGSEPGSSCCAELEALTRRSSLARLRAPRGQKPHKTPASFFETSLLLATAQPEAACAGPPRRFAPIPILLHKQSFLI